MTTAMIGHSNHDSEANDNFLILKEETPPPTLLAFPPHLYAWRYYKVIEEGLQIKLQTAIKGLDHQNTHQLSINKVMKNIPQVKIQVFKLQKTVFLLIICKNILVPNVLSSFK